MFMLVLIVAVVNFALGYAVTVAGGWASLPELGKTAAAAARESAAPTRSH